jgi:hypothetical protein
MHEKLRIPSRVQEEIGEDEDEDYNNREDNNTIIQRNEEEI